MKSMVAGTVSVRARSAMKTAAPLRTPIRWGWGAGGGAGGGGARPGPRGGGFSPAPQPLAPALLAVDEDHEVSDHEARLLQRLDRLELARPVGDAVVDDDDLLAGRVEALDPLLRALGLFLGPGTSQGEV